MPRSFWAVAFVSLVALSHASAAAPSEAGKPRKTQVIQAEVRTEAWRGWGGGEPLPEGIKQALTPEKFERFPTPDGQPQTFTGKVVGLPPGASAQVGVVALIGTQWLSVGNYKWQKVGPDATFSITGDHKPDARKALVVDVRGRVQTFLRAEFEPTESARDIELRIPKTKTIVITMQDADGRAVNGFRSEFFNAFLATDDDGNTLESQRLGNSAAATGAVVIEAPLEPIAILLAGTNIAQYYEIIDPRQADEFNFKMLAPSRIRGLVTRNGQPAVGQRVLLINDAAPLSATIRKTDAQGRFDSPGRTPGLHEIEIGGRRSMVQTQPGETADVTIELAPVADPVATQ